jgi:hypothetical protein
MSNMKQISTGIMMYVDDNNGMLPIRLWNSDEMAKLFPYVGAKGTWNEGYAFWKAGDKTLFFCPSATRGLSGVEYYAPSYVPFGHPDSLVPKKRSMWYQKTAADENTQGSARLETLNTSAPLFGEGNYGDFSGFGMSWHLDVSWSHQKSSSSNSHIAFRHGDATNYVTNDGSAHSIKHTGNQLFDHETGDLL